MRFFLFLIFLCFGLSSLALSAPQPTLVSSPLQQANPLDGAWTHLSTVTEHGCGGIVGKSNTVSLTMLTGDNAESIRITYSATGYSFTLWHSSENTYFGSYTEGAVEVSLTFTSPFSYSAEETVQHESGCIVRSNWQGSKD